MGVPLLHAQVEVIVATSRWEIADALTVGPLAAITDEQREILWLRVVLGLSTEQTATAVGSTPEQVRLAQHRALNRLRRELDTA